MASLIGSRTDRDPFSNASGFSCFSRRCNRDGAGTGQLEFAVRTPAAFDRDGGHLDFLVTGSDTSAQLGSTVAELAITIATMTDDHTAMFAGMARTAHNKGFEALAGFKTPTNAGYPHFEALTIPSGRE
jgi:hypothetical protein